MKILYIPFEINEKDSLDLLEFAKQKANILELSRYVYYELDKEILNAVNDEWTEQVKKENIVRKEKYLVDDNFRKSLLEDFGINDEDAANEFFDQILVKDLELVEEDVDEFLDENESIIKFMHEQGLEPVAARSEDQDIIVDHFDSSDFLDIDYGNENNYSELLAYETDRADYCGSRYSRISTVTGGPIFELSRFRIGATYNNDIHKQLENSIFQFPLELDEFYFEDPAFLKDGRAILAICSHENFATMNLTDEEYEEFLGLDIEYEIVDGMEV